MLAHNDSSILKSGSHPNRGNTMNKQTLALGLVLLASTGAATALPSLKPTKEGTKTTAIGAVSAASLYLAYKAYFPFVQEIHGQLLKQADDKQ